LIFILWQTLLQRENKGDALGGTGSRRGEKC